MSDLVVISFDDEYKADEVLLTLGRLQADHLIDLEDAAVVVSGARILGDFYSGH